MHRCKTWTFPLIIYITLHNLSSVILISIAVGRKTTGECTIHYFEGSNFYIKAVYFEIDNFFFYLTSLKGTHPASSTFCFCYKTLGLNYTMHGNQLAYFTLKRIFRSDIITLDSTPFPIIINNFFLKNILD